MFPASPLAFPVTAPGAAMVMAVLPLLLPPPPPALALLRLQHPAAASAPEEESNFSSSPPPLPPPPPPHPPPDQVLKWCNRIGRVPDGRERTPVGLFMYIFDPLTCRNLRRCSNSE